MGRPPKDDADRQTKVLRFGVTAAEDETLRRAATAAGKTLAAWARETLLRTARRKLRR